MKKTCFTPPLVEIISISKSMEDFCISGQDYSGSGDNFDDDSD